MSDQLIQDVATEIAKGYEVDRLPEVNHHDLRAAAHVMTSPVMRALLMKAWHQGRASYTHDMIHQSDENGNKVRSECPYREETWLEQLQK